MKNSFCLVAILCVLFLSSCISKKKILYFQGIDDINISEGSSNYEPLLKPDDMLYINVSASDPEAAEPFNLSSQQRSTGAVTTGMGIQRQTYLVDNAGDIQFPVLGTIRVGGLTKAELTTKLLERLKDYITDPVVNIRIMNYKVSVLGEVKSPGVYSVAGDRVTLPEVIAMAGDMTMYGKRDNILIVREVNGVKTNVRVDMRDPNLLNSPYYYLAQNDLVYVEPAKRRIDSTAIGSNITVGISIISFLITTTLILTRL
ncbi:MAG: polysaccharide biosynthesis/export family protein [Candidatus Kapabacteria bacterium]|jgi:polysaccharide export outer membrane protein|nr:polysaccharide biosynthesis/export family protein [Candidatus Kapabacteria bacterium]